MEYFHLTTPQQNIWNLQKYYEDSAIANLCGAVFFKEKRDSRLLQQAIHQFIENQSGMRLRFSEDGNVRQYLSDETEADIPVLEFSSRDAFDQYAESFAQKPLRLSGGSMYRFAVFHIEDRSGVLVVLSHLISDAWTFGLLANQLDQAYLNLSDRDNKELIAADYTDFIRTEDEYLASDSYIKDKRYWEEKYAQSPERSMIKPHTLPPASIQAERMTFVLPPALEEKLREYGRAYSVTPAVLFETAIIIYLSKINPENQSITIGVPVLNRKNVREKNIAGMFISTMPLTVPVDASMAALDLAKQITRGHRNLFRHQKYPYADILKYLREEKGFSESPYDVMVSYQNAKTHTGADTKWYSNGCSEVPLAIHIDNRDEHESHTINVDYRTAAFGTEEIRYFTGRLKYILEQIVTDHSRLLGEMQIVPEQELNWLLYDLNNTSVDYPRDKCVHELFARQAEKTPDRTALIFEQQSFTYRELDEMSNSLAHFLREKGIGPGMCVPILSKRSWHIVAAMLGVLKAGGAYMPVDPNYPAERITSMLELTGSKTALLYGRKKAIPAEIIDLDKFDFKYNSSPIKSVNTSEEPAYIIFTSGSTGTPKGIAVCHRNAVNYCSRNDRNVYGNIIRDGYRNIVSVTNPVFDIFVTETLLPLLNGLCIYFANDEEALRQEKLGKLFEENEIDVIQTTPTKMKSYLLNKRNREYLRRTKAIILGGEAFPADLYYELKECTDAQIFNIYGPAETTVWSSHAEVTGTDITIGKPIVNTQIYVLDQDKKPVPVGVPGELYIAGDGVGLGYLNRPDLTAERFVSNPFATETNHHGKIMYQTGDLARWRVDGEIEYLGRIDTQVKIRGLRIELGEIEGAMSSFPDIQLTAVSDKKDKNSRQYLVGYYTAENAIDEKELRRFLSSKLPKYMVPNYFVHLDEMPMTHSGKTDRRSLPEPDFTLQEREYTAPETETEKQLSGIWEELLGLSQISKQDDFFELGGDSLLAISMLNEIETIFQVEISIRDIMEHTVLEQLAGCIEQAPALRHITASHKEKYLLLPQQKAIYATCMKEPKTLVYNMPAKLPLPDGVDRQKLRYSITQVLNSHKILKSYIKADGNEIYGIYDEEAQIIFEEYQNKTAFAFVRPFHLERAPLVRVGFTKDVLLFDLHHIIADGDSLNRILGDIVSVYEGKPLHKSEIEYSDYADYFYHLDTSDYKVYFKKMLTCDFEPIQLPETNPPRQGGESKFYKIPEDAFLAAQAYARKNGMTDTMVFLAAYGILLSKYTGKREVLSSVILQNRVHAETKNLVGMFVNTLPFCLTVQGNVRDYMEQAKRLALDLFRYQELPFLEIADVVGLDKAAVNTSFVYQGDGEKALILNGQRLIPQFLETHTAKFDFSMELTPLDNGARMRLEYNREKYDEILMDRLAASYIQILSQLEKESFTDIFILPYEEIHKVIEEFNDTYVDYPRDKCVHELFSAQVKRTPDRIALVFEKKPFTYRELDEMSNSLAHFLREKGLRPGDIIPILSKRSWHVVVAMLGILKAGGAYMPVEPHFPIDRITYMLKSAESKIALLYGYSKMKELQEIGTLCVDLGTFDFIKNVIPTDNINQSEDPCYVIFTSGSTGTPKGVTVCHCNVVNYCNKNSISNLVCSDLVKNKYQSIVSVTNTIFDIFVTETLLPLVNGQTIYFANDEEAMRQERFAALVKQNKVDVMQTTPTRMRSYMLDKSNTAYLRKLNAIILGGEAFPADLYRELKECTDAQIFNIYGPAETTVWSSNAEVTGTDITIGKPIANTQIYILDQDKTPVPIGVPGELHIAGDGVGLGYLNRPDLTAERFVPNPFATETNRHGKIMYQTGDLARWRADGEIEYLGRIDTQVKIRGLRIELGEVEGAMSDFPGIQLTAVSDKKDKNSRQYLVGYYTAENEIDEREFRRFLSAKLPKYMVPNYFVHLDVMPMTPSGKTDRRSLPEPDFTLQEREYTAPETETEKQLAGIWEELLGLSQISKQDDFFELGGDSLLAISMLNEIETIFHVEISIREIMEHTMLEQLASYIEQAPALRHITASHKEKYLLLPQQKAIYAACMKEPKTLVYNMPAKLPLPDGVDRQKLRYSITQVLNSHKILKSYIKADGNEIYGIYDEEAQIIFEEYQDKEELSFVRPFHLEQAPLVRVGFTEDALLFDLHHIIADGDSLNRILRDIMSVYEDEVLHKSDIEYSDYADYFHSLDFSKHKAYFQQMLNCDFESVQLPESKSSVFGGESQFYEIPEDAFLAAQAYARKNGMTDTMVFLAAYGILLSKYTGKRAVLSSIILQNRTHAEKRDLVGMFVNTLPFYLTVQGNIRDYMEQIKRLLLDLFRYQELPFLEIADTVGLDKAVVNTSFVYQGDGEKALTLNGQRLIPRPLETHTAKFDFSMELTPLDKGARMRLEYNREKYDEILMERLAASYTQILGQLEKESLTDISVLPYEETHKVIEEFNDTYVDYPRDKCVHELFSEQVKRTPDRIALIFEKKSFTYRNLDEMSNSLAFFLREKGVKCGDSVAVLLKRDERVIIIQLAVLKLGAVFIPVDSRYPKERVEYILSQSNAKILIKNKDNNMKFSRECEIEKWNTLHVEAFEPVQVFSNAPCYIIFTSGSTGQPKGCILSNRGLVNFCRNNNILKKCRELEEQICISVNTISFDFFIAESLLPLLNGYTIVLASETESVNQELFTRLVLQHRVNIIQTTPTRYRLYFSKEKDLTYMKQLKVIVSGGEPFSLELLNIINENSKANIFNICGPSECSVWAVGSELHVKERGVTGTDITIGKPIANTQIYILDQDKTPVPIGVPGELYIAGDGVGLGYLNRPDLTAERFVPNPFATETNHHGKTMYQTGDLARWRADGEIEYLGRIDTQVKIRGLRIELGEVEGAMSSFPDIQLTAVSDKRDKSSRQYLVGYYTAENALDEKELRRFLSSKLPKYMVPNYFVHLDTMPMTPSGKTDRRSLPEPNFALQEREYLAPETEEEEKLCILLEELLSMEYIGIQEDFFELGGDSLTAMEYMAKAHSLGIDFSLQDVFDYPTVQALCNFLKSGSVPKIQYHASDFEQYRSLLLQNRIDETFRPEKKTLGSVLLTGATGFLGAHVLDQLMQEETGNIYCLIRGDTEEACRKKLSGILGYYFREKYQDEIGKRILPVMGDIENEELAACLPKDIQTVIHTAASVRHYGSYEYFRRVNAEGTRHVVGCAEAIGAKLIHISTLSVSGNSLADNFSVYCSKEEQYFYETSLYIGQPLDNVYIHSKFEAERIVYDAMLRGLDTKVIRVGNLTNRASDFKFQPNYKENAFLTREKALLEFGLFPDYLMPLYSEFSPVDLTANGIVRIAQYADRQTVFHLYSNRPVYFERFLEIVHELGIPMKVVEGAAFTKALEQTILNPATEYIYEAFQNDLDENGRLLYDSRIHIVNDFTVWFLKQTGFEWNETDIEYLRGYIDYFRRIGYFKV